jgi:hypothetical protein
MDSQKIVSASKLINYGGYKKRVRMTVTLRFDDECMNGHNSFSITANITTGSGYIAGGCLHEEIAKHFPEYREAIKWHLWDTNGKMHHVANGLYWYKEKGIDALRKYVNCPDLREEEATEEGLMARLPEQLEQFRKCIESLGMVYTTNPIQPSWKKQRYGTN